jgi:Protein of unknown function (DUF3551)
MEPTETGNATEIAMRAMAASILVFGAVLAVPAHAQTYDPNYPICLQSYGITGNYIACGYTSMAQCNLSASGRAAQCIENPYFGKRLR